MATVNATDVIDGSEDQKQINDKTVQYVSQLSELSSLSIRKDGMTAIVTALSGRLFVYDSSRAQINNGITIINGWVLKSPDKIYLPEWAGAVLGGIVDNTEAYAKLEAVLNDGDTVSFGPYKYLGSFVSDKALNFESHPACELIQPLNKPLIKLSTIFKTFKVVEKELNQGATKFSLSGVVSIPAGSLIVLWNNRWRDSANPVNFEILKVRTSKVVDGNTEVYPEKPVQSVQYGDITADLSTTPLQGITLNLKGKIINNTDHFVRCIWLDGVVSPHIIDIKTKGTKGHALSIDRCYDVKVDKYEFSDPQSVASGAGYGLVLFRCSTGNIGSGKCFNMRHDIDIESCYNIVTSFHESYFPQSSAITASHNGFCGNIFIGDTAIYVSDFPTECFGVSASGQGYKKNFEGQYVVDSEARLKHPIRNLKISSVNMQIDERKTVSDRISGVNLEVELINPQIGHIDIQFKNIAVPTGASQSTCFLTTGHSDYLSILGITANAIGQVANISNKSGSQNVGMFKINAVNVGTSNFGIYTSGYSPDITSFQYDRILRNICLECADNTIFGGKNTVFASINNVAQHAGANSVNAANPISANFLLVSGNSYAQGLLIGTALSVVSGSAITSREILVRNGIVILAAPAAASITSITVSMLPPVFYNGQFASISNGRSNATDRSQVILNGSNMDADIIIDSGKTVNLVSVGGKWRLK